MKYTLDEKFVLNEGFKLEERFILNERFILTEDATTIKDTIKTAIDALNIDKITKVINDINELNKKSDRIEQAFNVNEEVKNREAAEYAIANNLSWEQTKNRCNAYIAKLKSIIIKQLGIKLENLEALNTNIKAWDSIVNNAGATFKAKEEEAIPVFKNILGQADIIASMSEAVLKLPKETITKLSNFLQNFDNGSKVIKDAKELKDALLKCTSDGEYGKVLNAEALNMLLTNKEGANINSVIDAAESLPEIVDEKNLSETIDKLTKITNEEDDKSQAKIITNNLSMAKNAVPDAAIKDKSNKDSYWDAKYQQAGNDTTKKQNFWNEYWTKTWGENAEKIKKLGEAFTQELTKLSFGETLNPFLTFIRHNIIEGIGTDHTKLDIDNQHYAILHNAYVKKKIDDDDLRLSPGQILDSANVIFSQSLYTNPASDMEKYIDLQNSIINSFKASALKDPNIQALFPAGEPESINKLLKAIMYTGGNADTGTPGGKDLRTIKEIEAEKARLFGDTDGRKTEVTNKEIDHMLKDVSKDTAKKMIAYFIDLFVGDNEAFITDFLETNPMLERNLLGITSTQAEKRQYRDKILYRSKNYTKEQLLYLFKKLCIKAEFIKEDKPTEETAAKENEAGK